MTNSKRRAHRRIANDAPTKLKHEIWRWAEEQDHLKIGPKAFLNHLADHADEDGRVYVISRHFRELMNASARSITNYLRKLEAEELIVETGEHIIFPSVRLPIYRVAPNDPGIAALTGGSEIPSSQELALEPTQLGKLNAEVSKPDTWSSKTRSTYKNNSNIQANTQRDAPARSGGNAGPGVLNVEAGELDAAAGVVPIAPARRPPPAKSQTVDVPDWLRGEMLETLGEDWAASNLQACRWMENPNRLWAPSSKAERIFHEAREILARHDIRVVGANIRQLA